MVGTFKAIESFYLKRRNEFYVVGELLEGRLESGLLLHIPFNESTGVSVEIDFVDDVVISGESKEYTLIAITKCDEEAEFCFDLNVSNEVLFIYEKETDETNS